MFTRVTGSLTSLHLEIGRALAERAVSAGDRRCGVSQNERWPRPDRERLDPARSLPCADTSEIAQTLTFWSVVTYGPQATRPDLRATVSSSPVGSGSVATVAGSGCWKGLQRATPSGATQDQPCARLKGQQRVATRPPRVPDASASPCHTRAPEPRLERRSAASEKRAVGTQFSPTLSPTRSTSEERRDDRLLKAIRSEVGNHSHARRADTMDLRTGPMSYLRRHRGSSFKKENDPCARQGHPRCDRHESALPRSIKLHSFDRHGASFANTAQQLLEAVAGKNSDSP